MKLKAKLSAQIQRFTLLVTIAFLVPCQLIDAGSLFKSQSTQTDSIQYTEYKGKIIDSNDSKPLVFATLVIKNTNIATVTNSDGYYILKVPNSLNNASVDISYIGYKAVNIPLSELKNNRSKIKLDILTVSISEISVFPTNARILIETVLDRKRANYSQEDNLMTAFYRETIMKRKSYASLSEAVIEVYKRPYNSYKSDAVRVLKGRKSADYNKLDTILFKLQGGPYGTLMLDIMKNPYMILTRDELDYYDFEIQNVTSKNDRLLYVLGFKQKATIEDPLFYGTLYVDAETFAITDASYSINTTNKEEASKIFIKKKPLSANVYPTEATFMVKYREKDGKWIYGYSRGEVSFKINWDKKLFNTVYTTGIEMAVTDWKKTEDKSFKGSDKLKINVIMRDTEMGFTDPDFWGTYNVIEPEKSIDTAIKKIKKNLNKLNQ